jgi:hypothetical protein
VLTAQARWELGTTPQWQGGLVVACKKQLTRCLVSCICEKPRIGGWAFLFSSINGRICAHQIASAVTGGFGERTLRVRAGGSVKCTDDVHSSEREMLNQRDGPITTSSEELRDMSRCGDGESTG